MLACLAAAMLVLAPGPAPAPRPPSTPPPAATIFARARLAMYLRSYPRYVAYVIDVQSEAYGKHYHERYRALLRTHDRALVVKQAPLASSNLPPNPYGFTFFGLNKTGKAADHIEPPFGVPWLSALFDFDLARPPSRVPVGRPADREDTSEPVIGLIAVSGGDYAVSLIDVQAVDGARTYHLGLKPLHEPERNRVRELWVDAATYEVRKLVTQGIFDGGPAASVPWTVTFIQLHGHWFIRTESTTATLRQYKGITYTLGLYEYPRLISDLEFTPFPVDTDAIQM